MTICPGFRIICNMEFPSLIPMWVHPLTNARLYHGQYYTIMTELRNDNEKFFNFFRMSQNTFNELLSVIKKTTFRNKARIWGTVFNPSKDWQLLSGKWLFITKFIYESNTKICVYECKHYAILNHLYVQKFMMDQYIFYLSSF